MPQLGCRRRASQAQNRFPTGMDFNSSRGQAVGISSKLHQNLCRFSGVLLNNKRWLDHGSPGVIPLNVLAAAAKGL